MPIEGLSEVKRLPRLGKIRLGVKETSERSGKEYPRAVDYFVCPEGVQAEYGEKPHGLPVLLPSNEIEENFPVYLKQYGSTRGLVCKGDGIAATRVDTDTGEIIEQPCRYKQCEHYTAKPQQCKEIGVLNFLLPEVPGFGVWQIATSSINSIINLNSEMALAKRICQGRLAGLPFCLTLEPQDAQVEGKKKTIYVLHLRSELTLREFKALPGFEAHPAAALPGSDEMPEDLYAANGENRNGSGEPELAPGQPEAPKPANGLPRADDSASTLTEQVAVHIAASSRGLTKPGFREWLEVEFKTAHTVELTKEQCMAAVAMVRELTEGQVASFNKLGDLQANLSDRLTKEAASQGPPEPSQPADAEEEASKPVDEDPFDEQTREAAKQGGTEQEPKCARCGLVVSQAESIASRAGFGEVRCRAHMTRDEEAS